jgi:3'(2'), 5'-bisphosphate nucleotidase
MQVRGSALVEGKALGALGDAVSNAFLMGALRNLRPEDGILSEEEAADPSRLAKARVWIIDPLDGTREYSEGRSDWAVHVALTIDGVPAAGAVAMPGLGEVYSTAEVGASTAFDNRQVLVSRTRPPAEAEAVAAAIGGALQGMGSAGAKAMAVLRGEACAYVHSGGQYEWDSCAPACVAAAHGLHVSRIDGAPLLYNQSDPYMPDLLICDPSLADTVLKACAPA